MKYELKWIEVSKKEAPEKFTVDIPDGAQIVQVATGGWQVLVAIPVKEEDAKQVHNVTVRLSDEAKEVLSALNSIVSKYGCVYVSDFYDLVGIPSTFSDTQWGWTDLTGAHYDRIGKDRYQIVLPPVSKLVNKE